MNDEQMRTILSEAHHIAVVGHSDNPDRTSYQIAKYLQQAGYEVYPINPSVSSINGKVCYPNLAALKEATGIEVDIVDVFRRSEYLDAIVEEAIATGAKSVWAQLGVEDEAAAARAEAAGLPLVMDRCIKVEHYRLLRA